MKSSKLENIFNYRPPLEETKSLTPFTYYQPFQSSFDPEFFVPPSKSSPHRNPSQIKIWGQDTDRPAGVLDASGGANANPWKYNGCGFSPQPFTQAKKSFASGSRSPWGEHEGRSPYNSTWRSPFPNSPLRGHEKGQSERPSLSRAASSGIRSHFLPKRDANFEGSNDGRLDSGLASQGAPPFRTADSFGQPTGQPGNFDVHLKHPTCYPLMLGTLGKNMSQNLHKPGINRPMMCNFCKNNKEVPDIYLNHYLYDPETKVLSCPVLRKHVCEICGGTGDQAHTLQYCPVNRERGLQTKVPVLLKTRTITNSTGKIRRN